jgi:hypothetical protein
MTQWSPISTSSSMTTFEWIRQNAPILADEAIRASAATIENSLLDDTSRYPH